MKMEPIVSSETSAIRTQTPGNYPKRNKLHLEHGESLKTRILTLFKLTGQEVLRNKDSLVSTFKVMNFVLPVVEKIAYRDF